MQNLKKRLVCLMTLIALFLTPTENVLAAVNFTYDANGNMTADGQYCYTYNDANLLVKVKNCATNLLVAEYVYDSEGIRIVKKEYDNNGVLKQTTYSPEKEYETKKLASGVTQNTSYYYANGELVAKKNPDGSKNMYHNDYLGSTSLLTDQNGAKIEDTNYYPYGETRTGGVKSKYTYTGQEKDVETGLNYYGARYYNAHLRRFTQPDSVLANVFDPQQLNRYSYTRNNPLKYIDPDGHNPVLVLYGLSAWATAVTTAPDFNSDLVFLSQAFADYSQSATVGNSVNLGINALAMAIPAIPAGVVAQGAKTARAGVESKIWNYSYKGRREMGQFGEDVAEYIYKAGKQYIPKQPGFKGGRFIDIGVDSIDGIAHEVKTGRITISPRISTQIAKDRAYVKAGNLLNWDFFPSTVNDAIGGDKHVIQQLNDAGIGIKYWDNLKANK